MADRLSPHKWGWVLLFTSAGTLLCCALPIVLMSLGLGAAAAALYANLPFLSVVGAYRAWINVGSAILLAIAGWLLYRPGHACPADPALAVRCKASRRWNLFFFWQALGIWVFGVFFEGFFIRFFH
ncbi:MAG: hypothetical protein KGJ21_00630 [Pseudomonadota bacterium]|nr:hypothetical protein [Pseudomonadota bacterium]